MDGKVFRLDNIITLIIIIFITLNPAKIYGDSMIIDNLNKSNSSNENQEFCESSTTRWCFVTDKVMGGVSEGNLEINKSEDITYYKMTGNVSTLNNGGFIQFRTVLKNHPKNKLFDGVRIKVRGNNEKYAIHIRTKYLFLPWQYYEASFMATKDWDIIEIPFSQFNKSNFISQAMYHQQT